MGRERSVLVTGASSGIGFACARDLAAAGWQVFAGCRSDAAAERLQALPGVRALTLDVTVEEDVSAALAQLAEATAGRLSAVLNNAGVATAGPVELVGIDRWRRQFEVNLFGAVRVTQAALPLLRRCRGRVVFMGSIGGRLSVPLLAPYSSSKAAIESVADALRVELREVGVDVVVVEPGAVATGMWSAGMSEVEGLLAPVPPQALEGYRRQVDDIAGLVRDLQLKAMPPEVVSALVLEILEDPAPRDRYAVSPVGPTPARVVEGRSRRRGPIPTGRASGVRLPSFSEERLLFLDLLNPGDSAYNVPAAIRLRGPLDELELVAALGDVLARYDAFRTSYRQTPKGARAVVGPEVALDIDVLDLRGGDPTAVERRAGDIVAEAVAHGFDLSKGPLARFRLLRVDDEEHILVVVIHHIVCDGWSLGIVLRDLGQRLRTGAAGLAAPPLSFSDVVAWQRHSLASGALQSSIDHWAARLQGAETLDLPTDRPRPSVPSGRGDVVDFVIPAATRDSLRRLAADTGSTLFTVLLAAYAALLHRYTGAADVTIGTPVANRSAPDVAGVVGFVVNTLPWRIDVDGQATFRSLVRATKAEVHRGLDHQDAPFERIVEAVHPVRRPGENPLFRVMLVLQNVALPASVFPGLEVTPLHSPAGMLRGGALTLAALEVPNHTAKFDLTLQVEDADAGLVASFEYDADLFDHDTVERMTRHLRRLLETVTAEPDSSVASIDFLDTDERDWPRVQWERFGPRPTATVIERFLDHVRRSPDRVAVVDGSRRVTYAELGATVDVTAASVAAVAPAGSIVGVCLDRSVEAVAGVLAVLRAGCAFLPLDPSHPERRRAEQLAVAGAVALVTSPEASATGDLPAVVVGVRGPAAPAPCGRSAALDDLAYVVFTSGSTGAPKGVMVEHLSLASALEAWEEAYGVGTSVERHLQAAGFTFDVWIGDLVRAVGTGGSLVVCPKEVLLDPPSLRALIEDERIDFVELVPATARLLADHLERRGARLESLRVLAVGSDMWLTRDHERLCAVVGEGCMVVNSFGLTEATIDNALHAGPAPSGPGDAVVPIGVPLRNTTMYVLDAAGGLVPTGVVGELHVGGDCVARGYMGRPDLTAERFVPDPFSPRAGARMYRTGDMAKRRPDGSVECLGRRDRQVKVNGVRVELGDVEAAIASHPDVLDVTVTTRVVGGDASTLAGFVVPTDGREIDVDDLAAHVAATLPRALRPSAYHVVDALPRTTSGKADVAALHALVLPAPSRQAVPPRTELEGALVAVWQETLELPAVGIDDDFFELGGHSLLMTQVAGRLAAAIGKQPTIRELFEHTTIRDLARALEAAEASTPIAPRSVARNLIGVWVDDRGRARRREE